jgi:hypothetical protein
MGQKYKTGAVAKSAVLIVLLLGVWMCEGTNENMISLNKVGSTVSLRVGEKCYFTFKKWSSVGFEVEYVIEDKTIIQVVEEKINYLHPEKMKSGMTGGDEGKGILIFQAQRAGKTHLMLRELFRGEVRSEKTIKVYVK